MTCEGSENCLDESNMLSLRVFGMSSGLIPLIQTNLLG